MENMVEIVIDKINEFIKEACSKPLSERATVYNGQFEGMKFELIDTYPEPLKDLQGEEFWKVAFRMSSKVKITFEMIYKPIVEKVYMNVTLNQDGVKCKLHPYEQCTVIGVKIEGWRLIGDILIDNGVITPLQRDDILYRMENWGYLVPEDKFGDWAIACEFCDIEDVVKALYDQSGYEFPRWTQEEIDECKRRGKELFEKINSENLLKGRTMQIDKTSEIQAEIKIATETTDIADLREKYLDCISVKESLYKTIMAMQCCQNCTFKNVGQAGTMKCFTDYDMDLFDDTMPCHGQNWKLNS